MAEAISDRAGSPEVIPAASESGTPPQARPHGSRLDRWVSGYASRTQGMTTSEIRALFAVASRPEVVSLAGGMPYLAALPLDVVGDALARLVAERGTVALQYGSGQGDPVLRKRILDVMTPQRVNAHADDLVVTTGSQQALDLVTRIFVDPGDVVVRVECAGICGSDLHVYHGRETGLDLGTVMGHEFVGEIVEVGPGVRDFAAGTSSRSSKLFHGGLRYLEQFNFRLVMEASTVAMS